MLPKHTKLEDVLRRAMRRAGLVTGYVHKCRRHGCGHREAVPDANLRRCSKCRFKLFPVGEVRKIRSHHLRHTTASLLLMNGADLAAVQRIMRHTDPRLTTEVYGHLSTSYLKKEIQRLSLGPPPANERGSLSSAGGASEKPRPADTRAQERSAAPDSSPFTTRLLPEPPKGHPEPVRGRTGGKRFRGLRVVGARGFEPPTFRSRIWGRTIAGGANRRQGCAIVTDRGWGRFQPFAGFGRVSQEFFYPFSIQLERDSRARWRAGGRGRGGGPGRGEDATCAQHGGHARRPAGPLGRA